ncbi:MAG: hypothetical protein ISQ13_03775 [Candidatus Margulisbacteria bacterium]|nr:hypothetical protein [Candidatus Margulisiibacteriota bacterium]
MHVQKGGAALVTPINPNSGNGNGHNSGQNPLNSGTTVGPRQTGHISGGINEGAPPSGPAQTDISPLPGQLRPVEPTPDLAPPLQVTPPPPQLWGTSLISFASLAISVAANAAFEIVLVACIGQNNTSFFETFIKQLKIHSKDASIKQTDKPTTFWYLVDSLKDPEKFKAVLKSLHSPNVVKQLGTLEPILDNTTHTIQQLNQSIGNCLPEHITDALTNSEQINRILAQMNHHQQMFKNIAGDIQGASPDVDAFLDALADAAFFCRDRLCEADASLLDLRDFWNNHPASNLGIDSTPIQALFNNGENNTTILNHIETLLANDATLSAIEKITQELPFLTDNQQKKVALTFAMVPLLKSVNKLAMSMIYDQVSNIQSAVVALTDVHTPEEFKNWKTQHAQAILTLHATLNGNPELKEATMAFLNRAANHPHLREHAPYLNIVKEVVSLPSIGATINELASAVFEFAELMATGTFSLNTTMALFNPSLLKDLETLANNQSLSQMSSIIDSAIDKEKAIIEGIALPNATITSALTEFHDQQNAKTYDQLKQAIGTFFEDKIKQASHLDDFIEWLTKKNEALTALSQLEKYAIGNAVILTLMEQSDSQPTSTKSALALILNAHNRWKKPKAFDQEETIAGHSNNIVSVITSLTNQTNEIVNDRLAFFIDIFKFTGTPNDSNTSDIEQETLILLTSETLNLSSFNGFYQNHKKVFKEGYGLTHDLSTKAAMFNLLCAKATLQQRKSLLAIAKEMSYVDQIHIFHICTFPNLNHEYQPNAANYFENHMFCTSPGSSTTMRDYPSFNPIGNNLVDLIENSTHDPGLAGYYLATSQTNNLTLEQRQELLQFFKQQGSAWVTTMVSAQTRPNGAQLKQKLEVLGVVFFNSPTIGNNITDGIRDPLIEHILNDLTQTLPRFIATQNNKDVLTTYVSNVLTEILSPDSTTSNGSADTINTNLTRLLTAVETKINTLQLTKTNKSQLTTATTHPLKSLKRTLMILTKLNNQTLSQVFRLSETIFNAKLPL